MRRPHLTVGNILGTNSCQRLSRRQGHSTDGSIMSMKISNSIIEYTTRDLAGCSAKPQTTAPARTPIHTGIALLLLQMMGHDCDDRTAHYIQVQFFH